MSKNKRYNNDHFKSVDNINGFVREKKLPAERAAGSHIKVNGPRGTQYSEEHVTYYDNKKEVSIGVAHSLFKTFIKWGLIAFLVVSFLSFVISKIGTVPGITG